MWRFQEISSNDYCTSLVFRLLTGLVLIFVTRQNFVELLKIKGKGKTGSGGTHLSLGAWVFVFSGPPVRKDVFRMVLDILWAKVVFRLAGLGSVLAGLESLLR